MTKKGVKQNSSKLVYGIGLNDSVGCTHKTEKINGKWVIIEKCPYYAKWTSMLERTTEKFQRKWPTYQGVTVCESWLKFSNFKAWVDSQNIRHREECGSGTNKLRRECSAMFL